MLWKHALCFSFNRSGDEAFSSYLLYLKSGSHLPKFFFIYFNKSLLKIMKYASYFVLKALFVVDIFKFLSWLSGYVEKRLDKKAMVNFKIYDVTDWTTNNRKTYIAQYLKAKMQPDNEILSVNKM